MQTTQPAQVPLFSLLLAWAAHRLSVRLAAMKPKHTVEEAAAAAALSGNPVGS